MSISGNSGGGSANGSEVDIINVLEDQLIQLQQTIADVTFCNEELERKLDEKETELHKKKAAFAACEQANNDELSQLKEEQEQFTETAAHEMEYYRQILVEEEMKQERYLDLQAENERLLQTIDFLVMQINDEGHKHALALHEINKQKRILRQQTEKKFLKELASMDVSYQQNAFGSLTEKQKKSMFENAKLKDEVALQGVGIANLSARLIRQKQSYDACKKSLKFLNKKSRNLREQLAELALGRNQLSDSMKSIEHEEQMLLSAKTKLLLEIEASHGTFSLENIQEKTKEIDEETIRQNLKLSMWNRRLYLFQQLFSEIKPATTAELDGHFMSSVFSIDRPKTSISTNHSHLNNIIADNIDRRQSHSVVMLQRSASKASNMSTVSILSADTRDVVISASKQYKLADIEKMIESDRMLANALLPIKGKESCLVSNPDDDNDEHSMQGTSDTVALQNMMAWITFKILHMWELTGTETDDAIYEAVLDFNDQWENQMRSLSPISVGHTRAHSAAVLSQEGGGNSAVENNNTGFLYREFPEKAVDGREASNSDDEEHEDRRLDAIWDNIFSDSNVDVPIQTDVSDGAFSFHADDVMMQQNVSDASNVSGSFDKVAWIKPVRAALRLPPSDYHKSGSGASHRVGGSSVHNRRGFRGEASVTVSAVHGHLNSGDAGARFEALVRAANDSEIGPPLVIHDPVATSAGHIDIAPRLSRTTGSLQPAVLGSVAVSQSLFPPLKGALTRTAETQDGKSTKSQNRNAFSSTVTAVREKKPPTTSKEVISTDPLFVQSSKKASTTKQTITNIGSFLKKSHLLDDRASLAVSKSLKTLTSLTQHDTEFHSHHHSTSALLNVNGYYGT